MDLKAKKVVDIDTGYVFSIAITENGKLFSWGQSPYTGDGTTSNRYQPGPVYAIEALFGKTLIEASAGQYHVITLSDEGRLYAFGHNQYGELGIPSVPTNSPTNKPLEVDTSFLGGAEIMKIAAGGRHSLFITGSRTQCFGKMGVLACSYPKGICVGPNVCQCIPGYIGTECEIPDCSSGLRNDTDECVTFSCYGKFGENACNYPNGECIGQDKCLCFGHNGLECQKQNAIFSAGSNKFMEHNQAVLQLTHQENYMLGAIMEIMN
jgi:hypothetical protein